MHNIAYKAILRGDRLEWRDEAPPETDGDRAIQVVVTVSQEATQQGSPQSSGKKMAAALEQIANRGGVGSIEDPVTWQREIRRDRPLPSRD